MPRIAQYEPDQIQSSVTRGPRATANLLSFQPLAKGVSTIGNAFADMKGRIDTTSAEEALRINTTSAEEALNGFEKAKNDVLFNPDNGYYNTQGRNAYDAAPSTNEALEKLKNKFGDDLNEQSRQMFNKVADQHLLRSGVDISRHSAKGLKAWEVATIEAQVENTIENATLYWNNSKDLKVQRIMGEQSIYDSAELTGIGPEATNEKLQTYRSKFMSGAVNAATAQSSDEGQKLLDENKGMIEPQDKIKLQKNIDTKKKAEETQFNAGQATLTATRLVDDYDSRGDIQKEVNKIKDPVLRKKTMTEAMTLYSQKRQAEAEEQGDIFEDVEQSIMQGGTSVQFQVGNPEAWEKLSPAQQKHFTSDLKATEVATETDWNTYSGLMTMSKEALSKVNPVDYFDKLAKTERKNLISAVKTAKGASSKTEKTDSQVGRTRAAETKDAVNQIFGYKTESDKKPLHREKINGFYSLLDSEVQYQEDLKGSKLTSAEFTDILAGFTRKVVTDKGFIWDTTVGFKDIPTEDVSSLSKILRAGGVPVTNESMVQLNSGLSSANITNEDALQVSKFLKSNDIPVTAENITKAYSQASKKKRIVGPNEKLYPIPER